jgi:hypothetical protein
MLFLAIHGRHNSHREAGRVEAPWRGPDAMEGAECNRAGPRRANPCQAGAASFTIRAGAGSEPVDPDPKTAAPADWRGDAGTLVADPQAVAPTRSPYCAANADGRLGRSRSPAVLGFNQDRGTSANALAMQILGIINRLGQLVRGQYWNWRASPGLAGRRAHDRTPSAAAVWMSACARPLGGNGVRSKPMPPRKDIRDRGRVEVSKVHCAWPQTTAVTHASWVRMRFEYRLFRIDQAKPPFV